MNQLKEVVKAREATIAQLHNEQQQASIMLIAVRAERDRLQHQVYTCIWSPSEPHVSYMIMLLLIMLLSFSL